MEAFLKNNQWRQPDVRSNDWHERKLRLQWDNLVRRCAGPRRTQCTHPSARQLTPQARARVERIALEIKKRLETKRVDMKCVEMEAFLEKHRWRLPTIRSTDPHERKLRMRWDLLLRRCAGPIGQGTKPSQRKLTPQARARVERIELEIKKRLEAMYGELDAFMEKYMEKLGEAFLEKHQCSMEAYMEKSCDESYMEAFMEAFMEGSAEET